MRSAKQNTRSHSKNDGVKLLPRGNIIAVDGFFELLTKNGVAFRVEN
jgi:hypothetical protein